MSKDYPTPSFRTNLLPRSFNFMPINNIFKEGFSPINRSKGLESGHLVISVV